ncbi:5204_t:CDS:1, partial [Funneliformis geosporum]
TVNNVEKVYEPEINNITNCTPSESSHEIKVDPQSVNINVSQEEIPK